jgi:anaerobic ribonucleoside-triphosphate reductase activating protein
VRYAVFTQGCRRDCKGCHNPSTQDEKGGYFIEVQTILTQFDENPLLSGVTFSGGEPFLQPEPLAYLAEQVKARGKNVFTYSGYTFEELLRLIKTDSVLGPAMERLLFFTDTLVDGPYIEEQRDLTLLFRGSSNQRLLDKFARDRIVENLG